MVLKKKGLPDLWGDVIRSLQKGRIQATQSIREVSSLMPVKSKKHRVKQRYYPQSKRYFVDNNGYRHIYLTPREKQTFELLRFNFTVVEMAQHLRLSPRTVEFYVRMMRGKFNCKSKRDLVRLITSKNLKTLEENKVFCDIVKDKIQYLYSKYDCFRRTILFDEELLNKISSEINFRIDSHYIYYTIDDSVSDV